jgi:hypothetical protein
VEHGKCHEWFIRLLIIFYDIIFFFQNLRLGSGKQLQSSTRLREASIVYFGWRTKTLSSSSSLSSSIQRHGHCPFFFDGGSCLLDVTGGRFHVLSLAITDSSRNLRCQIDRQSLAEHNRTSSKRLRVAFAAVSPVRAGYIILVLSGVMV